MLIYNLRFGTNKSYYIFSSDPYASDDDDHIGFLSTQDYINSLVFVTVNFMFSVVSGIAGYIIVRCCYSDIFKELQKTHQRLLLQNKSYIGFVLVILAHNGLIALLMIQFHARIWWAFIDGEPDELVFSDD